MSLNDRAFVQTDIDQPHLLIDLAIEVLPAIIIEIAFNIVDTVGNFLEWLNELLGNYSYN